MDVKVESIVTLRLTNPEREWLHAAMQNPLHSDESHEDARMRTEFFTATAEVKATQKIEPNQRSHSLMYGEPR